MYSLILHFMLLRKGNMIFLADPWMEQTSQNSLAVDLNPKPVSKQTTQPQPSQLVPSPGVGRHTAGMVPLRTASPHSCC